MKPPKVAHVTTVDMSLRYLLLNQMAYLREQGYDVTGVSAAGDSVQAIEAAGVRHVPVPLTRAYSPTADLRALGELVRVFRRERFDLVHTHTPKAGLLGQWAAKLAGVPVRVHTIHGLYLPADLTRLKRRLFVGLERLTMSPSHRNLSQNPEDVPTAIRERISPADRIELIGNGIDLSAFDPGGHPPERRRATRARLGLDARHVVVGTVARFVAEKGYRELLDAARVVARQVSDVRFLLIGPSQPEKADALHPGIIEEMGLSGTVSYLGHRDDVADLYAAMDLHALPSYREGFPRAPMEAAAMGIPSVVSDVRGCRQTVDHGVTGLIVPPKNVGALADALLELIRNDAKRADFGRTAREKALAEFDERLVFRKVADVYEQLLGGSASVPAVSASSLRRSRTSVAGVSEPVLRGRPQ